MMRLAAGLPFFENPTTWVLFAFLLFVALLLYIGVPKLIGDALDKRAAGIRAQIDEARQLREEAQSRLADFERRQQEVKQQAEEIVRRAKEDATAAAAQAQRSIEASVAQRVKAAEDQIALAEAAALKRVRDEAVDAAIAATRDVLKASGVGGEPAMDAAISDVTARLN